jgi:hypothetical protein
MQVKSFVSEGEAMSYVAKSLGVSYNEAENLYCAIGGLQGYAVSFSVRYPRDDPFSLCMQAFMTENFITSLQTQYDD